MISSAIVSSLHLLALGLGLPAVFLRGRALKALPADWAFGRLFAADTVWGLAALLWVFTGLLRVFAGLEKGVQYYMTNPLFWTKMSLLLVIILLEIWPMITYIRWRRIRGRGETVDTSPAGRLYVVNHVQMAIVVVMVFVASMMARGIGLG